MRRSTIAKHGIIHIFLIMCCLIAIFPIIWIISCSFNASNSLVTTDLSIIPKHITLANYKTIFINQPFGKWLFNSAIITLSTTALSLILSATSAYAYSRMRFIGRKSMLYVFLLLNAFPNILSIVAYFRILNSLNLLNNKIGLIIIYTGSQLVFTIWNLKAFFDTIPVEIEEAAIIDGVSKFELFHKIILPLSKPAIAVAVLFAFMGGWNEYVISMTFTFSPDKFTVPVGLAALTNNTNQYATNWPLFSAGALIVALPVAALFLVLQRYLISGLTLGGVKG